MLTVPINPNDHRPIYEQIYLYIRDAITRGELRESQKLPSTRALADHLAVSRNTVAGAYDQLLSEGYLTAREKSGYYVSPIPGLIDQQPAVLSGTATAASEAADPPAAGTAAVPVRYDFRPNQFDPELFPYKHWNRLQTEVMRDAGPSLFSLGDRRGEPALRKAIAAHLAAHRGFVCDPDHMIIGAGADYLLQLLSQCLSQTASVAIEEPSYLKACRIFTGLGRTVCPISMDQSGMNPALLRKTEASVIYLTPSHQYPLGMIMPIGRKQALLNWAKEDPSRIIIEDDHDSEFRYAGKPIPALKGLDLNDQVVYIGTFSRSIAPAIRIGFMVLPERLHAVYRSRLGHYASTVSRIDQTILARFLADGSYERHVNRCRKIYRSRHDALLQVLQDYGSEIILRGQNAGMHLAISLRGTLPGESIAEKEDKIKECLRSEGILVDTLHEYCMRAGGSDAYGPTILLGYGSLPGEKIQSGVRLLMQILSRHSTETI